MIYKKLILFLFLFYSFNVNSQPVEQVAKLFEGDAGDRFGESVCVSGDYAIVGARYFDGLGDETGAAYIYYNDAGTWTKTATLIADDADLDDSFGYSSYISGDYAIVGALYNDDYGHSSGSAYIFYNDGGTWTQTAKLTPTDLSAGDYFGTTVSINGNFAIVGAPFDDDNFSNSGSAYIFYNDAGTWTQTAKINAPDGAEDDYFGYGVNIYGDYAIVGAYNHNNGQGAAYIFYNDAGSWNHIAKLTASDGADGDRFSYWAVTINDNYALVGAYFHDITNEDCGAAYIFEKPVSGWTDMTETQKLSAPENTEDDYFGRSVSIYQDYLVVGAKGDSENGSKAGAAYLYENQSGTWTLTTKITPDDGDTNDYFGEAVSINGNYLFIGAELDEENGSSSGSAYIFGPPLPVITSNPVSLTDQCGNATVRFSVTADNTTEYQWQINQGSGFMDLNENSTFVNTQTDVLSVILNPTLDEVEFRCVVSNPGGQTTSDIASLTLEDVSPILYLNTNYLIEIGENGEAAVNPDEIIYQISDNCGIADTIINPNLVSCSDLGMVDFEVTAIDVSSNTFTNTVQIQVVDNIPPDEPALSTINEECQAIVTPPVTTDNCSIEITGTTSDPLTYEEQGTYTITWAYDDGNGNIATQEQTVIVEDITNPTITCVDDQTINLSQGETFYIVQDTEFDPTDTADNCGIASVENDFNSTETLAGEEFTTGTYTISWTVTDNAGNTADCSFDLTVNAFSGISDISENGINIYPNPTSGILTITNYELRIKGIRISDIAGKTITNNFQINSFSNFQINISHLQNGVYLLKIETETGVYIQKIIKQ